MKMFKRPLAVVLMLCMLLSLVPVMAFAADTQNAESDDYRILHLDCGRKYFTKDWIIALINEMAAAGYNQLQLAFGNDGLRFLLDDMSVTVNGTTYSSANVTAGIQAGNIAYYDAGDVNELTESEMDEIIAHAQSKGIEIVPHMNMPGHMDAILDAIEYVGISDAHFAGYTESVRSLNLNNETAIAFTQALLEKYVAYFAGKGSKYFHIGADEFANDAYNGSMGFAVMGSSLYSTFVTFVQDCAKIVKGANMTPRAWNDGFYYGNYTTDIDTDIQLTYWSSGWGSGYDLESASSLSGYGHDMINTNGDYYYILGVNDCYTSGTSTSHVGYDYTAAESFSNTAFMGSTVSDPVGSMFCVWADNPGAETETEVAMYIRPILRVMAARMKNSSSYEVDSIVAGGFNADGTINTDAPAPGLVTLCDNDVSVTALALTDLTVTDATAPTIEGTVNVKAWDIVPETDDGKYSGSAEVSVPVPTDWNTKRLSAFVVNDDGTVTMIKGEYADGYYTFKMPHFSVAGIAEIAYDELIELEVGGTNSFVVEDSDLSGKTYIPVPEGVANVTVKYEQVDGETIVTLGNQITPTNSNGWSDTGVIKSGDYYLVMDSDGNLSATEDVAEATVFTVARSSDNRWMIRSGSYYLYYNNGTISGSQSSYNWRYSGGFYVSGYYGFVNSYLYYNGSNWVASTSATNKTYLYDVSSSTTDPVNESTVTFTGVAAGETYVTIEETVYKIVVSRAAVTANLVVDGSKTYNDASANVTVDDSAVADATLNNGTLTITGKTVGTTTVTTDTTVYTVTVTEVDLSTVDPLTIEYWITNQVVTIDGTTSSSIAADLVYSESGVDFSALVPASDGAETKPKVIWKGWLLPTGYHQEVSGSDMTVNANGILILKIRYWNGSWQCFNGTAWIDIKSDDQVVAYYLQKTEVTTEVTTSVVDWAQDYAEWEEGKDNGWFWDGYVENGSKYVFLDFAVVYEDGTQNPSSFPNDNTWFFHFDGHSATNPRVLGAIAFDENSEYEIWKVTVTDGTTVDETYTSASTFKSSYDATTETIVWDETYDTEPSIESLSYTANRSGKLIKIYVRAKATNDNLTVVYYDEKFGDTLYSYTINVPADKDFNNGLVGTAGTINNRLDVTGCGIENSLGVTQYFQTDLTQVPEAVGKYNSKLYGYTGSVISEDGKTLYLYYNIDTTVLSPNFVADFGLPLTFKLSDVVGENQEEMVDSVTVNSKTRYGTLAYNESTKVFTYTPTSILLNIDVLSISILFAGEQEATTTNVGVTPATTVYYEQTFLTYDSNWTVDAAPTAHQKTEILGSSSYYGYDDAYKNGDMTKATATKVGATASFTFTGTGFELYANSTAASGYVAVFSQGSLNKLYMIDTKLSAGTSAATNQQTGTYYSLPIISEKELPYGTYTVTIKITKDTGPVDIDGVRIINAIDESSTSGEQSIYFDDEEDLPVFYQLRDAVLNAIGVEDLTASGYIDDDTTDRNVKIEAVKDMAGQVYNAANDATAIILSESISYGSGNAQDLLDNGPKNELYLYPGQTLVFSVTTDRVMQLGLKAPTGSAKFTLIVDGTTHTLSSLSTTVDMFYKIAEKGGTTHTVSIEVSEGVLSVTDLKICDDPNFTFNALTQEDIESALMSVYGLNEEYADAVLSVVLKDRTGRELGTVELSANGVVGESAVFTAEQILAAAKAQLPRKYAVIDKNAVADIEVGYGQTEETTFRIGKIVSLRIVFGNHWGNKQPFEGGWASWLIPEILYEEG